MGSINSTVDAEFQPSQDLIDLRLTFASLCDAVDGIVQQPGNHLEMFVTEVETSIGRDLTLTEHTLICAAYDMGMSERRMP
jgi:hypothetical protein